jgi:hypothetical protein
VDPETSRTLASTLMPWTGVVAGGLMIFLGAATGHVGDIIFGLVAVVFCSAVLTYLKRLAARPRPRWPGGPPTAA